MSPFDRAHATSYSTLKSASILYHFRDIASYLSTHLTCIWCPCRGLSQWNFEDIFRVRKLESLGYLCCLFDPKFSCFGRTPTCDRHRQGHSIHRASIASRSKNTNFVCSDLTRIASTAVSARCMWAIAAQEVATCVCVGHNTC